MRGLTAPVKLSTQGAAMSENRIKKLDELIAAEKEKAAQKIEQLRQQKAQTERRYKAEMKKRERANDTRRKILLGACWLELIKKGGETAENRAKELLNPFLTRAADRELFGLPPLPEKQEMQETHGYPQNAMQQTELGNF